MIMYYNMYNMYAYRAHMRRIHAYIYTIVYILYYIVLETNGKKLKRNIIM